MVGVPVIDTGPMTVAEFYAFTDTRPDEEKWELIEGEPILNAAPSPRHQWIVRNLVVALTIRERELKALWMVLPGLGVRVSNTDRPEPDVLVIPSDSRSLDPQERDTSDVIAAFEVLSPSTERFDRGEKAGNYRQIPTLEEYVLVAQDAPEVTLHRRAENWAPQWLSGLEAVAEFRSIELSLPLARIYEGLP